MCLQDVLSSSVDLLDALFKTESDGASQSDACYRGRETACENYKTTFKTHLTSKRAAGLFAQGIHAYSGKGELCPVSGK